MFGPFSGAAISGVASWLHATALRDHGPLPESENDEEAKPLLNEDKEKIKEN